MIEYHCPRCGKQRVAPDEEAGKQYTCTCGNVNVLPGAPAEPGAEPEPAEGETPGDAEPAPEQAGIVYQGRPSQLENLWVFLGLLVVIFASFLLLPMIFRALFDSSKWGWYLALVVILGYAVWLAYRLLKLKCIHYTVTTENIVIEQGIVLKDVDNIDLFRVSDVNLRQGLFQRMMGIGNILIESSDKSMPQAVLRNIPEPRLAFERIHKAAADADVKRGVVQIER
jgi:membrane protein YdbS with pleckstrin-like domain